MNSNIQPTFAAKKLPPVEQQLLQQHSSPSATGSIIFSIGSNAGTAKASTTGKDFFKSPITTTTTTATTTDHPLFSSPLDHWAKSDAPKSLPEKKSRSLTVSQEAKKSTRKVRTTWSAAEDEMLKKLVADQEKVDWTTVSESLGGRNTKQCRDRWHNYLRPGIVKGHWTLDEEEIIKDMHQTFGAKWCTMAKMMKNRSENDIKNKWYSMTRKEQRLQSKSMATNELSDATSPIIESFSFEYQQPFLPTMEPDIPMPDISISMPHSLEDDPTDTQDHRQHPGQYR